MSTDGGAQRGMTSEEAANEPPYSTTTIVPGQECLVERKYWCFLLSSICTFLAGLLIVLIWRALAFLCCRKEPEFGPNDPKQKEQKAARQGKQEFEGTFMTEAKDWAGELISGQTTTGRILVSRYNMEVFRDGIGDSGCGCNGKRTRNAEALFVSIGGRLR